MTHLSVVTVTHNSSHVLEDFLEQLGIAADDEVIVVDSGSNDADESRRIAERHGATFIASPKNVGYGTGTNIGAHAAAGDWLAIVNPDVQISIAELHELVRLASTHHFVCVGPSQRDRSGRVIDNFRQTMAPPWKRSFQPPTDFGEFTTVASMSGACMVIDHVAFASVGGFDENFFMFGEEVDLHQRLADAGGALAVAKNVLAFTDGGGSSSTASRRWSVTERAVSHVNYMRKHFGATTAIIDALWRLVPILAGGEYKPRRYSLVQYSRGLKRIARSRTGRALSDPGQHSTDN